MASITVPQLLLETSTNRLENGNDPNQVNNVPTWVAGEAAFLVIGDGAVVDKCLLPAASKNDISLATTTSREACAHRPYRYLSTGYYASRLPGIQQQYQFQVPTYRYR